MVKATTAELTSGFGLFPSDVVLCAAEQPTGEVLNHLLLLGACAPSRHHGSDMLACQFGGRAFGQILATGSGCSRRYDGYPYRAANIFLAQQAAGSRTGYPPIRSARGSPVRVERRYDSATTQHLPGKLVRLTACQVKRVEHAKGRERSTNKEEHDHDQHNLDERAGSLAYGG